MTKRLATYGRNSHGLRDAIEAREPFTTGGALRATVEHSPYPHTGRMPSELAQEFLQDAKDAVADGLPLYVVWSYATPIGWAVGRRPGNVPNVKYSPTTSQHQAHARAILSGVSA